MSSYTHLGDPGSNHDSQVVKELLPKRHLITLT